MNSKAYTKTGVESSRGPFGVKEHIGRLELFSPSGKIIAFQGSSNLQSEVSRRVTRNPKGDMELGHGEQQANGEAGFRGIIPGQAQQRFPGA